jgi:acetyl esterase/lipase
MFPFLYGNKKGEIMRVFKQKKLWLVLLLVLCLAFILSGCQAEPTEMSVEYAPDSIALNKFSIASVKLRLNYPKGKTETVSASEDMLSEEDLAKLDTVGIHTITFNYKGLKAQTTIELLQATKRITHKQAVNMLLQGIQKTITKNNLNFALDTSFSFAVGNGESKTYNLGLKFTLDVNGDNKADNYIELEVKEDGEQLLAVFSKDDGAAPDFYLKLGGSLRELMGFDADFAYKFTAESVDSYFSKAEMPADDELWTTASLLKDVDNLVAEFLDFKIKFADFAQKPQISSMLSALFQNVEVTEDGTGLTFEFRVSKIVDLLKSVSTLISGATGAIDGLLSDNGIEVDSAQLLNSLSSTVGIIKVSASFDNDGLLTSLGMSDRQKNQSLEGVLGVNIRNKLFARLDIAELSVKADDTSFALPDNLDGYETPKNPEEQNIDKWLYINFQTMSNKPSETPPVRPEGVYEEINGEKTTDIYYINDGNEYHKLDIYYPANPDTAEKPFPVIIDIHGGGWMFGTKETNKAYCYYLASQGFAVVNISYRLLPQVKFIDQIQDIFSVYNFVLEHSAEYKLDTQNIFLTGDSAGGHLTMFSLAVLADENLQQLYGVSSDIQFKAAGTTCGAVNLNIIDKLPSLPLVHFFLNQFFGTEGAYAYKTDPLYPTIDILNSKLEDFPPLFISSSDMDAIQAHSLALMAKLDELGIDYELDMKKQDDHTNFLMHVYNISHPEYEESIDVNNKLCEFFRSNMVKAG